MPLHPMTRSHFIGPLPCWCKCINLPFSSETTSAFKLTRPVSDGIKASLRWCAATIGKGSYVLGNFITVQGLAVQHMQDKETGKTHFNKAGLIFLTFVLFI